MKIGIFDPYLPTMGGGEKYVLTIAAFLSKKNTVFIFWNLADEDAIKKEALERFNLDISSVIFTPNIFTNTPIITKIRSTKSYDTILYVSDGSIPLLFAKKNILLFQFPVNWVDGKTLQTKLKLLSVKRIICYSQYVKNFIDKTFNVRSFVLPPPIATETSNKIAKKNIILTVGRFTKGMNAKKQEVLMDVFKKMCDEGLKNWTLVIAGSVLPSDYDFVKQLQKEVGKYPIKILDNIPYKNLTKLYNETKIYWHAAGFGEDLAIHPERAEHFGISTVEAMKNGAVPVVIRAGGQVEIVEHKKSGFLWTTEDELKSYTNVLIQNSKYLKEISRSAIERSKQFNEEKFFEKLENLLYE